MTFTDLAKSYVRTAVPVVVGAIIAYALRHGVDLHGYVVQVTAVVTFAYYALARLAERYVSPQFGWLLGYAAPPDYSAGKVPTLKAKPSGSNMTVTIHADTSQALAALREVEKQAKATEAAVKKVNRVGRKRSDRGHTDLDRAVAVAALVLVLLVIFGVLAS